MVRVHVRLTPRASRDGLDGWDEDDQGRAFLKVRVTAAPVDGKANAALIAFMARSLRVQKSRITLISGETARLKTLEISDIEATEMTERLGLQDRGKHD